MKADGFRNRYFIKVGSSVLIAVMNIMIQFLLPRALSIEEYGYYSYNLNVFTSVVIIANLSVSSAFVAKLSKRNEEIGLIFFYLKFYASVSLLLCIGVMAFYPVKFVRETFAGQTLLVVMLGLLTAVISKLSTDCISMYDAFAISRFPAFMQIVLKVAVSIFVIAAYIIGKLNLVYFYIAQGFLTVIVLLILLVAIIKEQKQRYPVMVCLPTKQYVYEFASYCRPMILANVAAQAIIISMNWALMHWSGAAEQALFGAAWQLNALVSYIFSPYAELSKREFAVSYMKPEMLRVRFLQAVRFIIWLTSYFAIFIGTLSSWILPVAYGEKYSGAQLVTALIMYYTVYQAWGQICGSFMVAVEQTKLYAAISVGGQLVSMGFAILFQVPNALWPEGLGAVGIALAYMASNVIGANVSVAAISNKLNTKIADVLVIQMMPVGLCSMIALLLKYSIDYFISGNTVVILFFKILVAGFIYTIFLVYTIIQNPELAGFSQEGLGIVFENMKEKFRK